MANFRKEFQRKGAGGYKPSESCKEISYSFFYILTTMSLNSHISNTVAAPVSDTMDIHQIVAQAQEQL